VIQAAALALLPAQPRVAPMRGAAGKMRVQQTERRRLCRQAKWNGQP